MFSAKHLLVALTLALLAINAVESRNSQCHRWANGGKPGATSKQLVAQMVSDHRIMHPNAIVAPMIP